MTDVALASRWLAMLYGRTEAGWINLFGLEKATGRRRTGWAPVDNLAALGPVIEELGAVGDVWFGAAPRSERLEGGARGGVHLCTSIPALWLDIDLAGPAHKIPKLPRDKSTVVALLNRFPYQPTAVVHSGYGMQPWWFLLEPVEAGRAVALLGRWQATWDRIADEFDVHLDHVSNLDRVMRLPGTFNWKLDDPVEVKLRAKFERAYNVTDLEDFLEPEPKPAEREQRLAMTGHLAGTQFNERVKPGDILKSLSWIHVRTDRGRDSHWRHPKATNEVSATVYIDDGYTAVWSETVHAATGIPLRRPMDPFGLYTWLVHHGDFRASHADLLTKGYRDLDTGPKTRVRRLEHIQMAPAGAYSLVTRRASSVTPVHPEWLWLRWLPKGKLVVLEADPGTGKSTVALDLAARISRGATMPDGAAGPQPSVVLLMSAEDDLDDTTVWRLKAAEAGLDRVEHVEAVTDENGELTPVTLPLNVTPLWEKVEQTGAKLVVVDVLSSYLGGEVDAHKDASVRRALQPLVEMARATRVTVVLLRHLRKERAGKAIYQGGGSIGIAGAARAVHAIGYHPENLEVRVLAAVKVNIESRPKSISFRLTSHDSLPCASVTWGETVEVSADDLLSIVPLNPDTQLGSCRQAIRELLPMGKELPSQEFLKQLLDLGFTKSTIDRARGQEFVFARQSGFHSDTGYQGWLLSRRLGLPANGNGKKL